MFTGDYDNDCTDEVLQFHGHGVAHPDLTFAQQTEVFVAVVELFAKQTRAAYRKLWADLDFPNDPLPGGPGRPAFPDVDAALVLFEYGRLFQAHDTLLAFAGELGIEGYEQHRVLDLFRPVPDDPSGLFDGGGEQ